MVLVACSFFAKQHIIVNHINNLLLTDEGAAYTAYDDAGTRNGSSAEQKFRNLKYDPGLEMNSMTGKGSSDDCAFTNLPYETSNLHTENKYSQLCYPSFRSPSKTGTNNLTSTLERPIYDTASYPDDSQPSEGPHVYDTADHTHRPPPTNPQDEDYSKLHQPPVANVTPQPTSLADYDTATFIEQPVYDKVFPAPGDSISKKGTRHPLKSAGAYEEIEDEDFCGRDEYDTTYPPPAVIRRD